MPSYVIHTPHGEIRTSHEPQLREAGVVEIHHEDGSETCLSPIAWLRVDIPAKGGSDGRDVSRIH